MAHRPSVDFLIVVALKDELDAAITHFGFERTGSGEHFATIQRNDGGEYRVAIVNIGDMGPESAQRETTGALKRLRASRVILIGIAAGFAENDPSVGFGDLMVPQRIVNYEYSKIREKRTWLFGRKKMVMEHRGIPERVTQSLWHSAQTLAQSPAEEWTNRITVQRPDGTQKQPHVFAQPNSTLGCGSKVVASKLYDSRQWLIEKHPEVLGLEMESIGVYNACLEADADFLVIKASQDPATGDKDKAAEKDLWRKYACDVAAAFTRELVGSFRISDETLVSGHYARLDSVIQSAFVRESPLFEYRINLAASYTDIKRRHFQHRGGLIDGLLPNDSAPYVALLGGGGTGKSNIARRLLKRLRAADMCPVLFDLGKYEVASRTELRARDWSEMSPADRTLVEEDVLTKLISQTCQPRHSLADLAVLARETQVVAVVDGLNEVPPVEHALLLKTLKALSAGTRPYIVVTARLGLREAFDGFALASVDLLEQEEVKGLYDRCFSEGEFDLLDAQLKQILRRPFFLALAMRGPRLSGLHNWSGIFSRFFDERLRIGPSRLDEIAAAAFESLDSVGGVRIDQLKTLLGPREYDHLVEAEVIDRDEKGFDHELWRDYLASRYLASHPEKWIGEHFDRVTVKASSFECLMLTMEQVPNADSRDALVKAVYDWNLPGAVECLEYAGGAERSDVTRGLKIAILSAIADRSFDRIAHSRDQARAQLVEQPSDEAKHFATLPDRNALVAAANASGVSDPWFQRWLGIFALSDAAAVPDAFVTYLTSDDPIIGWAASNAIRRGQLTVTQASDLRGSFALASDTQRWRIAHSLGTHGSAESITLLSIAFASDSYPWVRYGAARSLVEIAALNEGTLRDLALGALLAALPSVKSLTIIDRQHVLRQVVGSTMFRGALGDWKADTRGVLELTLDLADDSDKGELQAQVGNIAANSGGISGDSVL